MLSTLLNIIWVVLAGLWLAIASFRIAGYALWPFGRTVADHPSAGALHVLGNIIWFLLAGFWLAIGHIVTAIPLFISIIGIPLGWANLKIIPLALMPLGKVIIPMRGS